MLSENKNTRGSVVTAMVSCISVTEFLKTLYMSSVNSLNLWSCMHVCMYTSAGCGSNTTTVGTVTSLMLSR